MHCSKCGSENPGSKRFCGDCGAALENRCAKCGAENPLEKKFCGDCGARLETATLASAPRAQAETPRIRVTSEAPAESVDGERKTVTILFADIKGSMDLMEDLDPEDARTIVDPALNLMIDACRHYDGYVAQSTGDGVFALFGAPLAHEDHPQRALYAALRLQSEMRRYSARLRQDGRLPIEARVGVNTGQVVVRSIRTGDLRAEYVPIGHSAGLAARMQALAPTGSIAATDAVRILCEGYFIFESLGPTKVKGVTEPVNVHEVTGLGPMRTRLQRSAGRGLVRFVGRQREMDAMKHAAAQAGAGHGQIVAVVGEAGVGKSRLLLEFKAVSQSGWKVLEAFSVSHGRASAFLPVIDLLWSYFKINSDDDERTRREKINGKVLTLDRSLEDALPYLYVLLGLADESNRIAEIEAQTRNRRALDAIKRILLRESLNQPLMVIFEDLHWIDSETQAFLNLLADSIGTARILLLVNYRREYRHEWAHKTYYTQLRLDPLGKESADQMLSVLLGDDAELAELKRLIIGKTEGNPLFIEEMVLGLFEEGALVRNGAVKLTHSVSEVKIPTTVQAVLAARIDRLTPDQKDLLQMLAVMGTEFSLALICRVVAKPPASIERTLSELQLAEFIYEQPATGGIEYTFKHALTHDVAYDSLLAQRRRSLHGQIGEAFETLYAASVDDHVTELARHYARSGKPPKAVEYGLRACQQCADRGAYIEAAAHFEASLELLGKLPDDDQRAEMELDLRTAAQPAFAAIKGQGSPEALHSSERAVVLAQRPGVNWQKRFAALLGIFNVQLFRDVRQVCGIADQLIALAEKNGSTEHRSPALLCLAWARIQTGEFEGALEILDRAIAHDESISNSESDPALLARLASNLGVSTFILWCLGYPDRALERLLTATTIGRASGCKGTMRLMYSGAGFLHLLRGDFAQLKVSAEANLALTTELGDQTHIGQSEIFLGWSQAMTGDLGGGLARMRRHVSVYRAAGAEWAAEYFLALIAIALGRTGQHDEALGTIGDAMSIIEKTGEKFFEAEVHRVNGELLLAQDPSKTAEAENSFRTAIDISRKQKAKSWELRATSSLARLLAKQGQRDKAHAMLAEIYGWFTEGFDTADLIDAKALLDELRGKR
jgi:class 3 adenylate cyclase/tetratricopeptide (TPR) repeat protein